MTVFGLQQQAYLLRARWRRVSIPRDAFAVFGVALGVRVLFSLLVAGTFDKDEFVYLAGRPWVAHYSWDDPTTITSLSLERQLGPT